MSAVDELVIKWSMDSQEFDKGLTSMNRSMNLLKSSFGVTSEKLKSFGSETDQLKNKQEYLNKAMEIQKAKIDTLKKSYDNQVKATGENSKEAENLAIKLNNQIKYYNNLESELSKTNAELELQSNKWNKVSKNLGATGDTIKGFGSKLSAIGSTLTTKVTAPLTAAFALLTKGTQELRMDMSKLEANINSAGLSIEETSKQFTYLSAITGETDSSIEALSNLLNSGLTQTQMQQAVDNLSGAIVKFPDTLKIESLADSLQETLATGEATGQYGELLERLGVNLDDFNLGLQEATVNGTAQQYALDILAKNGLANLNEEYQKNNEQMIKNAQSQQELQNKFAEIGEKLTPILTKITEFGSKIVDSFLNLDEGTKDTIIQIGIFAAALGPVISIAGSIVTVIGGVIGGFSTISGAIAVVTTGATAATPAIGALATAFTVLTGPVGIAIATVTALIGVGVLLWQNWDVIKEKATQLGNWLGEKWQGIKDKTSEAWNSMKDKTSEAWGNMKAKIEEHGGGIKGYILASAEANKEAWSKAFNLMDNVTGGALTRMKDKVSNGLSSIRNFFSNLSLPEIKLPHIKLPHFNLSGSFSLKPPSVPKLNVDWYHTGAIFTKPTVLGGIGVGDAYKGTGANAEAVIPLDSMYQNVRSIVREEQGKGEITVYTTNVFNVDGKELKKETTKEVIKVINKATSNYSRSKGISPGRLSYSY